jgi:sulfite reductase alpha subunit-like flavoprotein
VLDCVGKENMEMTENKFQSCKILFSTQSGRAKACARRTARILREQTSIQVPDNGYPFDEAPPQQSFIQTLQELQSAPDNAFLLLFVSTTGDGEHCDSIRNTWKSLLNKALSKFPGGSFAMFCLGDRAYGPQFCAAGRKLAVRLLQLGLEKTCEVGYGDDNTPEGGVFRDLDLWLTQHLLPILPKKDMKESSASIGVQQAQSPYRVTIVANANIHTEASIIQTQDNKVSVVLPEWQSPNFADSYNDFFATACPITAYFYTSSTKRIASIEGPSQPPLFGRVISNERITASDWGQNTRHLQIHVVQQPRNAKNSSSSMDSDDAVVAPLPYQAGDIATILPSNSDEDVTRFLEVLPNKIRALADAKLEIELDGGAELSNNFTSWPHSCTFRGWLKYCADIHSLPEREDLRALSPYCCLDHPFGRDQAAKLVGMSETTEAALYADYILREKRSWVDVFYDFDSLRSEGATMRFEDLLVMIPPIRPRHFSIASAPSMELLKTIQSSKNEVEGFSLELCVAVVEGRTALGRFYHGLCSDYLSRLTPKPAAQPILPIWIRPGSFGRLPLDLNGPKFQSPVMCVGAGTGIAPLRSILQERDAVRRLAFDQVQLSSDLDSNDNILVFGCRKASKDFYYKEEWESMCQSNSMRLLTAFSRDQEHKVYVMQVIRQADNATLLVKHLLERRGAIYIAGGPKMSRHVKDEILEALAKELGTEKMASQFLSKLQRVGKFSIEAWS